MVLHYVQEAAMERFTFKKAELADLPAMREIITEAQGTMAKLGIDQWQDGYPTDAQLILDIEKGVTRLLLQQQTTMGTAALCFGEEADYKIIREGNWITEGTPYAAIHRIAVRIALRGKGASAALVQYMEKEAKDGGAFSVRVDTHPGNLTMLRFLQKQGYTRCGLINLATGATRVAFEKLL